MSSESQHGATASTSAASEQIQPVEFQALSPVEDQDKHPERVEEKPASDQDAITKLEEGSETANAAANGEEANGTENKKKGLSADWLTKRLKRERRGVSLGRRFRNCVGSIGDCIPDGDDCGDCCGIMFKGIGYGILGLLVVGLVLSPLLLYGTYMYFLNYADIFPGSKVAYDVWKTQTTGTVFGFFYWFTATLAASYLVLLLGLGIAGLAEEDGCAPCICFAVVLMVFVLTIPYWLRFPVLNRMYNDAWQNSCNNWEIRAILNNVDYTEYLYSVPEQIGNISVTINNTEDVIFSINRRPLTPLIYDMILESNSPSFYANVTYDLENLQITTSNGLNTTYTVEPNLAFPSLNLSLANPGIPWVRPDYYTCWPTSVNIVHNGVGVLQTVTVNQNDCTQMLVCGTAGDESENFQIVLGLTAVSQFQYAICCTAAANQVSFSGQAPEDRFGDNGGDGEKNGKKGG